MMRRGAHMRSGRGSRGGIWNGIRGGGSSQRSATTLAPPYGGKMHAWTYEELKASLPPAGSPRITSSQYMASFNWLESNLPTIAVPGLPPKWTPQKDPPQLREDDGDYYRDINAAQYPRHSIEPAVRAVLAQCPTLATTKVDLFACGSTLGNLLRFARQTDKLFRFVVEAVGDTVFFVRRENSPTEKILDVRGYGHSMPEAYTSLDDCVKKSVSHQRLIKYDLDGFECIVRYEADGYFDKNDNTMSAGELVLPDAEGLRIIPGGKVVPQDAIFDIKTRSLFDFKTRSVRKRSDEVLAQEIDRLWLRQIPNFILAYHQRGVFDDIELVNVTKQTTQWETEHEDEIRILSSLMAKIIEHARDHAGTFEVCSQQPGIVEFRHLLEENFHAALPEVLKQMWSGSSLNASGGDTDEDSDADSDTGVGSDPEGGVGSSDDDEAERDYTACSAEDCGYCGRCKY